MEVSHPSVHIQTARANRLGFRIWANKNNKNELVDLVERHYTRLEEYGERIPLDVITAEIQAAADIACEANLGLRVIDLVDVRLTSLGSAIGQALMPLQQQNLTLPLGILLKLTARYFQVLSEVVTLDVHQNRDHIRVSFSPYCPQHVSYHQIEGAVYGLVKMIRHFHGAMPQQVRFSHVPNELHYDVYQQCFQCYPEFACDQTQLVYDLPQDLVSLELPVVLSPLVRLHEQQFPNMTFAVRVRLLLQAVLGFIEPTRDTIAAIMNLSVSSLQRRLKQEHSSFHQELLQVRQQLSLNYLQQTDITSEKLAFLLGYKAKSQFLKAFRQWFGQTPQEYRKNKKSP